MNNQRQLNNILQRVIQKSLFITLLLLLLILSCQLFTTTTTNSFVLQQGPTTKKKSFKRITMSHPNNGINEIEDDSTTPKSIQRQSIFIIRHGDRWDYSHPEWKKTSSRPGDPSLSTLGHRQARDVGVYLDQLFHSENIQAHDVTLLSSPFLRCIQTSNEILSEFKYTIGDVADNVHIQIENSIFEYDLWKHDDLYTLLPTLKERKNYFPRIDTSYQSLFTPTVPENTNQFLQRCEKAMEYIDTAYCNSPVLIIVTHAACCIGLVKAATKLTLQDINAASPCSIYRLNRTIDSSSSSSSSPSLSSSSWEIDHYSQVNGMNGYIGHLSDLGDTTIPWNHFDRTEENSGTVEGGYTGPPIIN